MLGADLACHGRRDDHGLPDPDWFKRDLIEQEEHVSRKRVIRLMQEEPWRRAPASGSSARP
jgi:hypothetical protein